MKVTSEIQAIEIATNWLKSSNGEVLPLRYAYFVQAVENDESDGFLYSKPAHWLVSFQCDAPEGFYPDHADLEVDPETGEVEALPMM